MSLLRGRLATWWQSRSPREQRLLLGGVFLLVAALWLNLLWTAHVQRPRLRLQVEQLERQQALATALARRIAAPPAEGKAVAAAPSAAPPALAGLSVQPVGNRYRIAGNVAFDAWLAWLATVQRDAHLTLVSVRIRPGGAQGQAGVDGELERAP